MMPLPASAPRTADSSASIVPGQRRPVPGLRRALERLLYVANPFRCCNSFPRAVRDSAVWETLWLAADPARSWYWRAKNAAHPAPATDPTPRAREMVAALREHGIVIRPGFVPADLLRHMRERAAAYARAAAGIDIRRPAAGQQCHLNNMGNDLPPDDPIMSFLRGEELLSIASAHLGFTPRLRRLALFFNQPQSDLSGPDNVEKHFHTDTHDFRVLKLFAYLDDTGPDNGPFTYVRNTHFHGNRRGIVCRLPAYSEISEEEMESFVPRSEWIEATGPAGTITFAETSGVHRGGRARAGHRLMLVAEYASHHPWHRFDHDIRTGGS